jgi:uncharacterized protein (DUF58 family)/transglutaminase-like putative cysteine protease
MTPRDEPERTLKLKTPLLPILVIALVFIQLFFPFKGWVILLTGFGGMWLVGYLWSRSLKQGLRIDREMRFDWKQVGDRLRERVSLENNSWAPGLWVEVDDHSDMSDYEISSVAEVRGWRYHNWHTQGVCTQRGIYTLGPVTLKSGDPFGIYEVAVDYTDAVNMMVAPPVIALPEIEIASGERIGEGKSSIRATRQTISTAGVREYVPGDSLRWLHWPTTARIGEPFVHIFDDEPTSDWWILLDMDPNVQAGVGKRSTIEHGIILGASLVNRGLQLGKYVGLVAHGDELAWHPPKIGDTHLWTILRSLAKIQAGGPTLTQVLNRIRTSLGARTSLIIITPNLSPDWINALELVKRLGIVPTVLILDPETFGGAGQVEVFRRRLMKLGVAHYTIEADLLDSPKKELKDELTFLLRQTRRSTGTLDRWQARWQKLKLSLRNWALLFVFFGMMARLISGAVRGLETDFLWSLLAGGMLAGWLVARSKLNGRWAVVLNSMLGLGLTTLSVGSLGNVVTNAVIRFAKLVPLTGGWVFGDQQKPDLEPLLITLNEITSGISALASRLWTWLVTLAQGQSIFDPVSITFNWGIVIWSVTVWAMWGLFRRKKILAGFVPALLLVAYSLATVQISSYDIIFMLGAVSALMVFYSYDTKESAWKIERLNIAPEIRTKIFTAAVALTLGLMFFSLVVPSVSIDRFADWARRIAGQSAASANMAQSMGLENQASKDRDTLDTRRAGGLPNSHLIGSGSELADEVVMTVKIESIQSGHPEDDIFTALQPLYLRSLTYDRYVSHGWESRAADILDHAPGEQIITIGSGDNLLIRQQITMVENLGGLLHTVGDPLSTDQDFRVSWRMREFETGAYDMFGGTVAAESYRADSIVEVASVEELRAAGQLYPRWVQNRYLILPASVPDRVLSLARELTATELTPYDRAVAIERYLRQFPYTLDVSTGPAGADVADYFLFSLQKGYCDYYSTAMVVLARAAGLPARYVQGYIGENYDAENDQFVITADQAHAWVEIYFPEYGWIIFEPTGGRQGIDRPVEPFLELTDNFELDLKPLIPENRFSFENWVQSLWSGLFFVLGVLIGMGLIADWWLSRLPMEILVPRLFKRIYRYGRWSGIPLKPGDTVIHFKILFDRLVYQSSQGSHWPDWIAESSALLEQLTNVFVPLLFNSAGTSAESKNMIKTYQQLRYRLWLLLFLVKIFPAGILRSIFWLDPPLYINVTIEDEL